MASGIKLLIWLCNLKTSRRVGFCNLVLALLQDLKRNKMPIKLCLAALFLTLLLFGDVNAQPRKVAVYDSAWLPISATEVQRQVGLNAKNVVGLYSLWRHADFQHQQQTYFSALEKLREAQPKNGILMAMRCAAIEDSIFRGTRPIALLTDEWTTLDRRANLEAAKKMSPSLWLNYLSEANLITWEQGSGVDPKVVSQQIRLCRVAIKLAPNLSFTNNAMGGYLSTLSRRGNTSDAGAIRYYRKAQQLAPRICDPNLGLVFHYRYNKPNAAERVKAQKAVLATIPPGTKLAPHLRQFLLKQGITPPR